MMEYVETVEDAGYEAKIYKHAGVRFTGPDGLEIVRFGPSFMRGVAAAQREADPEVETDGSEPDGTGSESERNGFEDSDFLVQNGTSTVGMTERETIRKAYNGAPNPVVSSLFRADYLRDALDAAEPLGEHGHVWIVATTDGPVSFVPRDGDVAVSVANRRLDSETESRRPVNNDG